MNTLVIGASIAIKWVIEGDGTPDALARQVGLDRGLVEEHQPMGRGAHVFLAPGGPQPAGNAHIQAVTLLRDQPFFDE